jgi:hypothetical protein
VFERPWQWHCNVQRIGLPPQQFQPFCYPLLAGALPLRQDWLQMLNDPRIRYEYHHQIKVIAKAQGTVLIIGESGTGKELEKVCCRKPMGGVIFGRNWRNATDFTSHAA